MIFSEETVVNEINIAGIVIPSLLGLEAAIIISFTVFIIFMVKRRNDINARKTELKKQKKKLKNGMKKADKTKKKIANGVKTKTVTTKKINVKPANKNH